MLRNISQEQTPQLHIHTFHTSYKHCHVFNVTKILPQGHLKTQVRVCDQVLAQVFRTCTAHVDNKVLKFAKAMAFFTKTSSSKNLPPPEKKVAGINIGVEVARCVHTRGDVENGEKLLCNQVSDTGSHQLGVTWLHPFKPLCMLWTYRAACPNKDHSKPRCRRIKSQTTQN